MPRRFSPKVVTSNHLLEGDAIYLSAVGGWTREFGEAKLFSEQAKAERALAEADRQRHVHVGAYLADAEAGPDGRPRPTHFREEFRTKGPSNYFHGKQAEA